MELSDITFGNITDNDYNDACVYWYRKTHTNKQGDGRFSIITPFVSDSYERLIEWFMDKHLGFRVSVNKNGRWIKFYKNAINNDAINEISNIARNDLFDGCNFELYFKLGNYEIRRPEVCKLKFAKRDESIIAYHVIFMNIHAQLFSFNENTEPVKSLFNDGLYVFR